MKLPAPLLSLACLVGLVVPAAADASPRVHTEARSTGAVEVTSVHLRLVRGGVVVSGRVERAFGYGYPGPDAESHLDVNVLNPRGRFVGRTATTYLPRPIPVTYRGVPGRSTYAVRLPVTPVAGDTVRVSHHQARLEDCPANPATGLPAGKG